MNDLFHYKSPETPTRQVYTIRPYLASDERNVYDLCRRLHLARFSSSNCDLENSLHSFPDLIGDVYVLSSLNLPVHLNIFIVFYQDILGPSSLCRLNCVLS